jgi:hypothetical protein
VVKSICRQGQLLAPKSRLVSAPILSLNYLRVLSLFNLPVVAHMQMIRRVAVLGFFAMAGLATGQTPGEKLNVWTSELYPLQVGNEWNYRVKVGDAKQWQALQVAVDHEEVFLFKHIEQTKDKQTGGVKKEQKETPIKRYRFKITSGSKELTEYVAILSDGVYKFTVAGKEIVPPLLMLKLPAQKVDSWKVDSVSENVPLVGKFTSTTDKVIVPAGEFNSLRVSAQDFQFEGKKMTLDMWFAPKIGIVKQHTVIGSNETLMELERKPNLKN